MATLKELGVDDDTIVFFASDNGAHLEGGHSIAFFNSTGGLRGHKRSYYEGGVRSPTLARWPGHIAAGAVSGETWAFWDVLPTFAELAGAKGAVPAGLDGSSIVPTLLGTDPSPEPGPRYQYFTWHENHHKPAGYGIRVGKYKGVVQSCVSRKKQPSKHDVMELYDLDADPFEQNDISGTHASEVAKLKAFVIAKDLTCTCYQC